MPQRAPHPDDDLGGLVYQVKKVVARVRATFRGPKPRRTRSTSLSPSPSTPTPSTVATTKKTTTGKRKPAAAKATAAKRKPAAAKATAAKRKPTTRSAATATKRTPRASTTAAAKRRTGTGTTTRRRTNAANTPAIKKTGKVYPYKNKELRAEWEKKGWGIDKEVSNAARAVRKGGKIAKSEAGYLRRQSVQDKKNRMKKGALAGTPKTRTRKVGAAKRNPNWKPTAAQKANLSPEMIAGLRRYHTGK